MFELFELNETGVIEMKQIVPKQGEFIILASDDWRIFDNGIWRPMTVEEQLEASE